MFAWQRSLPRRWPSDASNATSTPITGDLSLGILGSESGYRYCTFGPYRSKWLDGGRPHKCNFGLLNANCGLRGGCSRDAAPKPDFVFSRPKLYLRGRPPSSHFFLYGPKIQYRYGRMPVVNTTAVLAEMYGWILYQCIIHSLNSSRVNTLTDFVCAQQHQQCLLYSTVRYR